MSNKYKLLIMEDESAKVLKRGLENAFDVALVRSVEELERIEDFSAYSAVLLGPDLSREARQTLIQRIKSPQFPPVESLSVIVITRENDLNSKLDALQAGCEDYITISELDALTMQEIVTRIQKLVFLKIANSQLQSQVKMAQEAAFSAMNETSNLGINIHFLLESFTCNNLDELGMLLFHALGQYGLKCSLQMRGRYAVKNMEPNGMAKELESQLLSELKDAGRYYDFGSRTVMNYGQVSLLVKNMPVEDEKRYGAIKDNVFSLLQGTDARIKAMDDKLTMERELQLVEKLTSSLQSAFARMDEAYQHLIRELAKTVDTMGDRIADSVISLGLTEEQEQILEGIVADAQTSADALFTKGMRVDEEARELVGRIAAVFSLKDRPDFYLLLDKLVKKLDPP